MRKYIVDKPGIETARHLAIMGHPPSRDGDPHYKRRKIFHETATSEQIHSAQQLQHLLTFSPGQDFKVARHGLSYCRKLDPDRCY